MHCDNNNQVTKNKMATNILLSSLDGRECKSSSRLDSTSDSAMFPTHSWLDVTVFTTCRWNKLQVTSWWKRRCNRRLYPVTARPLPPTPAAVLCQHHEPAAKRRAVWNGRCTLTLNLETSKKNLESLAVKQLNEKLAEQEEVYNNPPGLFLMTLRSASSAISAKRSLSACAWDSTLLLWLIASRVWRYWACEPT